MSKVCDVCGKKIGFRKFRYVDGYICKDCYAKASRRFTEVIRDKSLAEIRELCSQERDEESFENFHVTGKIGNYLLVDEDNLRVCIPSNRMTNRQVSDPEFYDVSEMESCEIRYQPDMPLEELTRLTQERKSQETVSYLKVRMNFKNGFPKDITLISNPVRIKSYAFRQTFDFALRIQETIARLIEKSEAPIHQLR